LKYQSQSGEFSGICIDWIVLQKSPHGQGRSLEKAAGSASGENKTANCDIITTFVEIVDHRTICDYVSL